MKEDTPLNAIKESIHMTIKRIRASVTNTGGFGPRVQSRETSKASTARQLGVTKPKPTTKRGKALAAEIIAEEARRGA
ncbi:hypothetical protein [Williamsia sp. R60]